MSIYSPLLSAGAGWVWFVCTLVSVFLIITISRHLCCLFLPQEREPCTVSPALTCEEGKVLACLERAHHRSMLLFHSKWEKLLFFPRRNKICNRKKKRENNPTTEFTHCRRGRSKTNLLFRFLSKQSGTPVIQACHKSSFQHFPTLWRIFF